MSAKSRPAGDLWTASEMTMERIASTASRYRLRSHTMALQAHRRGGQSGMGGHEQGIRAGSQSSFGWSRCCGETLTRAEQLRLR